MLLPGHVGRPAVLPKPTDRSGSLARPPPCGGADNLSVSLGAMHFRVLSSPGNQYLSESLDLLLIQKCRLRVKGWPLRWLLSLTLWRLGRGRAQQYSVVHLVSIVCPHDHVADWELWLSGPAQHHEYHPALAGKR